MSELENLDHKPCQDNAWTDHLLEEYGRLELPSLYDFLLVQEKIAAEIRKQNKELRYHSDKMQQLIKNVDSLSKSISELSANFEEREDEVYVPKEKRDYEALISMMDAATQLVQSSEKCLDAILGIVPEKFGYLFSSKPKWREQLENIIRGYREGLETIHIKLESSLEMAGITLIYPPTDSEFDPASHRAVETIPGDLKLLVKSVVRCGYQLEEELLRPAEVVITT